MVEWSFITVSYANLAKNKYNGKFGKFNNQQQQIMNLSINIIKKLVLQLEQILFLISLD